MDLQKCVLWNELLIEYISSGLLDTTAAEHFYSQALRDSSKDFSKVVVSIKLSYQCMRVPFASVPCWFTLKL